MPDIQEVINAQAAILGLSHFAALRRLPFFASFYALLERIAHEQVKKPPAGLVRAWSGFERELSARGGDFPMAVYQFACMDDNEFNIAAENSERVKMMPSLQASGGKDLSRLRALALFDVAGLSTLVAQKLALQGMTCEAELAPMTNARRMNREITNWFHIGSYLQNACRYGTGCLSAGNFFYWGDGGAAGPAKSSGGLVAVRNPDAIRLSGLSGYEDQRRPIIDNTLSFLAGRSSNNILLYGDRGTGKSATVKAICNEYARKGLRLVELRKENLPQLRAIMEQLGARGLYFIIFIDDLSFEAGDSAFTSLKGVLEGGVEKRPANVLVYATSNRRHFIHEKQSDRPASQSDVRSFDTMQEQLSLADRFGLTVVFASPSQAEYLAIAEFLADAAGLFTSINDVASIEIPHSPTLVPVTREVFRGNALRWERWFNGRSPRTAAQYVDWLLYDKPFPWD
jgi:predicted AAA+ superfamily ATPase